MSLINLFENWTVSACCVHPIWTGGGGQNGPLRDFAEYLKNGLANRYETL